MNVFGFALCFGLFAVAFAAFEHVLFSMGFFKDPAHPGKCVYGGLVLAPGEDGKPEGKCEHFMCSRADGFGKLQRCKAMAPCKLYDNTKRNSSYPECCMRSVMCRVIKKKIKYKKVR